MQLTSTETVAVVLFEIGITSVASAYLGFDVRNTLTESQAKEFHKFILPMITREYTRLKDDEVKVQEFMELYNTLMPAEILVYLVTQEMEFGSILPEEHSPVKRVK